jgi:hypothetical protein
LFYVQLYSNPPALIAPLRSAISSVDAAVPVFDAKTLEDHLLALLHPGPPRDPVDLVVVLRDA